MLSKALEKCERYKPGNMKECAIMQDRIIKAMEKKGYYFDDINSYKGYYVFHGDYCTTMTFSTVKDIKEWLKNVVID